MYIYKIRSVYIHFKMNEIMFDIGIVVAGGNRVLYNWNLQIAWIDWKRPF